MNIILESIELSLSTENYLSALFVSLSLPDICGKLENKPISSERYIEWFQKYLKAKYDGYLSGSDCYSIRCALLHEGSDDITDQKKQEIINRFIFLTKGAHLNRFSNSIVGSKNHDMKEVIQISVYDFCLDFIDATKKWLIDVHDNKTIQNNIKALFVIHKPGEHVGRIAFS